MILPLLPTTTYDNNDNDDTNNGGDGDGDGDGNGDGDGDEKCESALNQICLLSYVSFLLIIWFKWYSVVLVLWGFLARNMFPCHLISSFSFIIGTGAVNQTWMI